MFKKLLPIFLIILIIFLSLNCRQRKVIPGLNLEILFSPEDLTDDFMTEISYSWKTNRKFIGFKKDYSVFVEFWHGDVMLLEDNHIPQVPTSVWKSKSEYSYSRRIYIPTFIDEYHPEFKGHELIRISTGLYSQIDLAKESKLEIFGKKIKVFPPPLDTPEITYEHGWYDLEFNPTSYLKQWRWMGKSAKCIIDNPKKDALLVIKGGINKDAIDEQKVIIKINNLAVDEFIPEESFFEKSYEVFKEMLGDGSEFSLVILTNKTFIPSKLNASSTDGRELGLRISFIYFR